MKLLAALFTLLSINLAQAETGTIESYLTSSDKNHPQVVHLYLQNSCYQDVFIATRAQNPNGVWETKGYMRLFPGQIIANGDITNNLYYLNAFSGDGRIKWEGEHRFDVHGTIVKALLVQLPKDYYGNWTTVLYCR